MQKKAPEEKMTPQDKLFASFTAMVIAMMLTQLITSWFLGVSELTMNQRGVAAVVGVVVLIGTLVALLEPEDYPRTTQCPKCGQPTLWRIPAIPGDRGMGLGSACSNCGHTV